MQTSIVIAARNEALNLDSVLLSLTQTYPPEDITVVDDGSIDDTANTCARYSVTVISHPYPMGNGAAIKTGARAAKGDVIVFLDGDGQHNPEDIPRLLDKLSEGYEMVVGARTRTSQATWLRWWGNELYNRLASWIVGHRVDDLTSGLRAVKASRFKEFLYLLPNGFSYPTTITMAFFRAGYPIAYVPIVAKPRTGDTKSHIRIARDGLRFFLIIFRVGTLYSPLKVFFPVSVVYFILGLANYFYTYVTESRFTNMSAVLFTTAVLIFLIGLVSEQITNLLYSRRPEL
jgi:glycosyltransferase involved in cell wall biosynthesis